MSRLLPLLALTLAAGCAKNTTKGTQGNTDGTGGEGEGEGEEVVEPLAFTLTAPSSGAIVRDSNVVAEGSWSGGLDTVVTVNGVDVGPEGSFAVDSAHTDVPWPDSPLWPVLGDARDAEGSWLRARSTLIHGDSAPALDPIDDGLMFRLTDNVLAQLDVLLDTLVADLDLSELLVGSDPVGSILVADVYITGASFGDLIPSLDFESSGLAYSLRAEDVLIEMVIDAGFLGTYDADLEAAAIIISGDLVIGVDGSGGLTATPSNTSVATEDLELFGFTDSIGLVDSLLGDTIAATVEEQLVDAIDGLLEAQEDLRYLEFSGIAIVSDFTSALHDNNGVTILADSRLELTDGTEPGDRLATDASWSVPTGSDSPGGVPYQAGLFLDDDLLSALGASLAAGDLLKQEVSGDLGSITLDTSLLGAIVPGFDTLPAGQLVTLVTRPSAPLVGQAGREGYAGELHIGGLELDFKTDEDGDGTDDVVMTVVVDAVVGLAPGEDGELLSIDLVESRATLLSTSLPASPDEVEPGLASLIDLAVPALVGGLLGDALDLSLGGIGLEIVDGAGVGDRAALFLDLDLSGFEL